MLAAAGTRGYAAVAYVWPREAPGATVPLPTESATGSALMASAPVSSLTLPADSKTDLSAFASRQLFAASMTSLAVHCALGCATTSSTSSRASLPPLTLEVVPEALLESGEGRQRIRSEPAWGRCSAARRPKWTPSDFWLLVRLGESEVRRVSRAGCRAGPAPGSS